MDFGLFISLIKLLIQKIIQILLNIYQEIYILLVVTNSEPYIPYFSKMYTWNQTQGYFGVIKNTTEDYNLIQSQKPSIANPKKMENSLP